MDYNTKNDFDLYKDIQNRCRGEIYIGVVGPVRCGKSTFIKRFMDEMVLPYMEDEHELERVRDELPQSAGGKTITTTEPKFIPKEAAIIKLGDEVETKVRLIDCVGFMVEGAQGHLENEKERMVKTPWFEEEIPFTQAAMVGTEKVIKDHSTIGLVLTTDGSFSELERNAYVDGEEKTIAALKKIHKPFLVLLNTNRPYSEETKKLVREMVDKYQVKVLPVNCAQLKKEDIHDILKEVLFEFPISKLEFYMPGWVEMLPLDHKIKVAMIKEIKDCFKNITTMRELLSIVKDNLIMTDCDYIKKWKLESIDLANGCVKTMFEVDNSYYYEMLSEMLGEEIKSDYQLLTRFKEMSAMKAEYDKVSKAMLLVRQKGYGVVIPERDEIILESPELIRHGNKFGVKMKAQSPTIHLIKANIETEIAPIVGAEEQARDLIAYINDSKETKEGIWETNIFGKTVEQLVYEGMSSKISMIGDESQLKLQDSMQKIANETNGGMVCIII